MTDWHFNVGDDGWVGVIDVEHHNGESRAFIGAPAESYGDIDRFREFGAHYDQLKKDMDRLLGAVENCKYAEEVDHYMRGSKAYLDAQLKARDRLYRTAQELEDGKKEETNEHGV